MGAKVSAIHLKVAGKWGDNWRKEGELKARAAKFRDELQTLTEPRFGTIARAARDAMHSNIDLISRGKGNRIELSSQKTYFSTLHGHLRAKRGEDLTEFGDLDWNEFARRLRTVTRDKRETITQDRVDAQNSAATWFMRSLQAMGYPIPDSCLHEKNQLEPLPTRAHACVWISQNHVKNATVIASEWLAEDPKFKLMFRLAMSLLTMAPWRWGELSCLTRDCLLKDDQWMFLEAVGFSHLKSDAGWRLIPVTNDARSLCTELALREIAIDPSGKFLFIDKVSGIEDRGSIEWLHELIIMALRRATHDPEARAHDFRGYSVMELLYPGWQESWLAFTLGEIGPHDLSRLFAYSAHSSAHLDRVKMIAGHAHGVTTLSYYCPAWQQLRSMALAATLRGCGPTPFLIKSLALTEGAFRKEVSRKDLVREDPWRFLVARLPRVSADDVGPIKHPKIKTDTLSVTEAAPLKEDPEKKSLYLALRLFGETHSAAIDSAVVSMSTALELDQRFKGEFDRTDLRGRVRGNIDGRAKRADLKMLRGVEGASAIKDLLNAKPEMVSDLHRLLLKTCGASTWEDNLESASAIFNTSDFCIRVVIGELHTSTDLARRLSVMSNVTLGSPQRDLGEIPMIYIIWRDKERRSTVSQARLTVLFRVLCTAVNLQITIKGE